MSKAPSKRPRKPDKRNQVRVPLRNRLRASNDLGGFVKHHGRQGCDAVEKRCQNVLQPGEARADFYTPLELGWRLVGESLRDLQEASRVLSDLECRYAKCYEPGPTGEKELLGTAALYATLVTTAAVGRNVYSAAGTPAMWPLGRVSRTPELLNFQATEGLAWIRRHEQDFEPSLPGLRCLKPARIAAEIEESLNVFVSNREEHTVLDWHLMSARVRVHKAGEAFDADYLAVTDIAKAICRLGGDAEVVAKFAPASLRKVHETRRRRQQELEVREQQPAAGPVPAPPRLW